MRTNKAKQGTLARCTHLLTYRILTHSYSLTKTYLRPTLKALSPMVVRVAGKASLASEVHEKNAASSMVLGVGVGLGVGL
jgi:hypothetical protein